MIRMEFQVWAAHARRGDRIVYFNGHLHTDREKGSQLDELCAEVWRQHLEGRVVLVQQRVTENVFRYMAVKLGEPYEPVKYTGCYEANRLIYKERSHHRTRERIAA